MWRLCDVVTGDESWFYHTQIGRKSSNTAWVAKEDPPPTVSTGPVLVHRIEHGQIVDHQPSFGTHGIKLLHDNGKPHVHKAVFDYLESKRITIIPHPPNSPDLAPCDFWLFDLIKQNRDDQNDAESLRDA
ncbi:unnamed protein product, partial [Rotaria sp. Silwood1]